MNIRATFIMPHFTSRADAADMAEPHGLKLLTFQRQSDGMRATFAAQTQAEVDGLSADLSYPPDSVETIHESRASA